jgi:methionyl-tRNA formyltransferase
LLQRRIALDGSETTASLTERVAAEGGQLLAEVVDGLESGGLRPVPQDHRRASYCALIEKGDGEIDWRLPAREIERMTRAYNPWPGAYTFFDGKKLTIWGASVYDRVDDRVDARVDDAQPAAAEGAVREDQSAAGVAAAGEGGVAPPGLVRGVDTARGILIQTGEGVLAVERLQLQSRGISDWKSFLNGARGFQGSVLGRSEHSMDSGGQGRAAEDPPAES